MLTARLHTTHKLVLCWCEIKVTSRYSFALTSTSLKDFSFLHGISRGSFNTSRSNGWFQDVFRLGNTGWRGVMPTSVQ